ncbi:MAG TPA: hypothetical protein DHV85_14805 [Candidatus Accumulibacter sp.]|nr:hypothetical protein [Accumulibacter sp.]
MPEVLDRCQACRARLTESAVCPRCGCDFSLARRALEQGRHWLDDALRSLAVGDRAAARRQVDAALALSGPRLALALKTFLAGEPRSRRTRSAANADASSHRAEISPDGLPQGELPDPDRVEAQ